MSQTSNINKRINKNTLHPNTLYEDGVAIYEPCHIEYLWSNGK